jgi:hypothetical protein
MQGFWKRGRWVLTVEVPRNEEDGSFTSDSVAQTLKLVKKDEEGKIYRDKAKEMATIIGDKSLQSKYIYKLCSVSWEPQACQQGHVELILFFFFCSSSILDK